MVVAMSASHRGQLLAPDDVMLVPARGNMASVSVTALNEAIGQVVGQESCPLA